MNQIKFESDCLKAKSEVHLLPCKLYFNGEAAVESFFSSSITKSTATKAEDNENGMLKRNQFEP